MDPDETHVQIGAALQGGLGAVAGARFAVVIAHPHPRYGGSMRDEVVVAIARALRRRGAATLRFDFRAEARDDKRLLAENVDDARAALRYLGRRYARVGLAAYSYGSAVAWTLVHGRGAGAGGFSSGGARRRPVHPAARLAPGDPCDPAAPSRGRGGAAVPPRSRGQAVRGSTTGRARRARIFL